MLDKARRPAAGPPPHEPGSPASGSGPGPLRRRWRRTPRTRTPAARRDAAPSTLDSTARAADTGEGTEAVTEDAAITESHTRPASAEASRTDVSVPNGDRAAHRLASGRTGRAHTIATTPEHASAAGTATGARPTAPETTGDTAPTTPATPTEPRPAGSDIATATQPTDADDGSDTDPTDRRSPFHRAVVLGGGRLIAPGWRERAAREGAARPSARQWTRRQFATARARVPDRTELAALLARRPSTQDLTEAAQRHRFLLGGLVLTLVLAAGDATSALLVTEHPPAPGVGHRVAVAYPLRLSTPVPSVRRYLDAIDNGERLREQAVVAAAARATLERAKAEAAAAAAGQEQPWIHSAPEPGGAIPPGAVRPGPGGFVLPAPGTFTSGFGSRWGTFHRGIDVAGPIGTPIYAVADGTVIDAGPAQGFGLWVRIRHDDGTISVYGHVYDFFVSVGERVPAGMQIARMGNRGDSTGPHLHFEIIMAGRHVDPQRWLAVHGLSYG